MVALGVERIGRLSRSAASRITPGTLTAKLPWPVSIRPAAISRLLLETALNISCCEMPKLSSLAGSIRISSCSWRSPSMSTSSTVGTVLSSSLRSRARRSSVRSGTSPESEAEITGCSAVLNSCTEGRVGLLRHQRARLVDLGADVLQRLLLVEVDVEFHDHDGDAGIGARRDGLRPLDRAQAGLERLDQKALAVLRADAGIGHLHHQDRDRDVGLGLFRDLDEGDHARDEHHQDQRDDDARVVDRPVDDSCHDAVSLLPATVFTVSPSVTNSCPTVMTLTRSGRPAIHMPSGPSETICTGRK